MAAPDWAQLARRHDLSAVTSYAYRVVAGRECVNKWVRLACERHLHDLVEAPARGYEFDRRRAELVFNFFEEFLCLPDDPGTPFVLLPWEQFVVGSIYGWVSRETRYRRFREGYIEVGKGNGKSPLLAGLGIYGLVGEGEKNPEIFSAAPIKDQAARLWDAARMIVEASPALADVCRVYRASHTIKPRGAEGYFRATTGESATKDGPIVFMALVDELHEHKDPDTIHKLRQGFKTRKQPLLLQITNSGSDDTTICYQQREKTCRVLDGQQANDQLFGYIAGVDENDDPFTDEGCWPKANPSLGATIDRPYIRELIAGAHTPQARASIERLNFGIWNRGVDPAFCMKGWGKGQSTAWEPKGLEGEDCWIGVDLASKLDLASAVALFRHGNGWRVVGMSFTPEKNLRLLESKLHIPLRDWVRDGHLILCPGDQIDPRIIRDQVIEWAMTFCMLRFGFDPWNAGAMPAEIQESCYLGDHQVIEVSQTIKGLTWATKQLQADVRSGLVDAGDDPLMRWQVSNVMLHVDGNENVKPMKNKTPGGRGKIDQAVAMIIARECARLDEADTSTADASFVGTIDLGL